MTVAAYSKWIKLSFAIIVWILSRLLVAYLGMLALGSFHAMGIDVPPLSFLLCLDIVIVVALMTKFLRKLVENVR